MNRREFLCSGTAAGAAMAVAASAGSPPRAGRGHGGRFGLAYAARFGMFRHHAGDDFCDQIRFLAEEGFAALSDHRLRERPPTVQVRIGRELERLGMQCGPFVAVADFSAPTFASGSRRYAEAVLAELSDSIEVAGRTGARSLIVTPGKREPRLRPSQQRSNAVALLRRCADLCERAGVEMLLEPLDLRRTRPPMFLRTIGQARALCRAVGSPACRILFDVYRQHEAGGNVLAQIDEAWNEIGGIQLGDAPGGREPGTGGIDFPQLFQKVRDLRFEGLLALEHGLSQPGLEGERAVIDAYGRYDPGRSAESSVDRGNGCVFSFPKSSRQAGRPPL